jgi:hypothetical protein
MMPATIAVLVKAALDCANAKEKVMDQDLKLLFDAHEGLLERVRQLEKHIHYPHNEVAMKEAAAKAQAQAIISEAYPPPMRADTEAILALTKFAKRLINPDDLGHAVTFEVRQLARRALGLPEVKEYDL